MSLACPLTTYGIPETELELYGTGTRIEGEHRHLPEPLEVEGLDVLGVEPLPLGEVVDDRLPVKPPWQELPPVVDKNGQIVKDGGYIDGQEVAFGDQLLSRALDSPFGSEWPIWDSIEVDNIEVVGWAAAPRGPDRQPRVALLVATSSTTREIWLVERPGGQWRTVEMATAPRVVKETNHFSASWGGSGPRYLIVDRGALHWTRSDGAWESLSWLFYNVWPMSAAPIETGWLLSEYRGDFRDAFKAVPGKLERVSQRFVAESENGGRWEIDDAGHLRRRTADGRLQPVDAPRTEIRLAKAHDGALLAWADEELLFWPAEACARPWRWPLIGGLDEVNGMGLTDAYVVRTATGFTAERSYTEWRARPDRTPTDDLE